MHNIFLDRDPNTSNHKDSHKDAYRGLATGFNKAQLRAGVGGIYEVEKTSGGSVTRKVTYHPVAGAMFYNFSHSSREIPACFRILESKSFPISP